MDRVEFRIAEEKVGMEDGPVPTIHPVVNGTPLRDLARLVEMPYATTEGKPDLAGSYLGLVQVNRLRWPSRHYLDEPDDTWFDDGDTVLLGCVCGDSGCWPLTADIELTDDVVSWRHFRTGHRDWDLSALGPFTFERLQYEEALCKTGEDGPQRAGPQHR